MWTKSPTYLVNFHVFLPPQVAAVMGDSTVCAGTSATFSTTYLSGVYYMWSVPVGWTITAGINTSSITVTAGTENGFVVVTPANSSGVGAARTLGVSVAGATTPGTAVVAEYACDGGISEAGTAAVVDYACSGGITEAGTAAVVDYSCSGGITSAGTIYVIPY